MVNRQLGTTQPIRTQKKMAQADTPLILPVDFGLLAGIPLMAVTSWLLPVAAWEKLAYASAPYVAGAIPCSQEDLIRVMEKTVGNRPMAMSAKEAARRLIASEIVKNFQFTRDHLPGRWHPQITIDGQEHIDKGLETGKGVILWDSHFYFASLMTKIAMFKAGHRLIHLSRPQHGFSPSRFAKKVLNPIRIKCEERYIAERVVLAPDNPISALRTLGIFLKQNAVVSITVRATGIRPVDAPFMDNTYPIATGAPDLAYKYGATLLPVFTQREDDGGYRVVVDRPLGLQIGSDRKKATKLAVHEYARRLEHHVLCHPEQWVDWYNI
jgi:lauroyl/myristoyl acyltransferase